MNESYVVEAIIRAIDDGFTKNMKRNEDSLNSFENKSGRMSTRVQNDFMAIGGALTIGVTRPIVGMFKESIASGTEFDAQMKMTQSVLGATTKEMKRLEDQSLKLGAKGLFNASEIGSIQEELASAGFTVEDILDSSQSAANIATLSASKDTGTAAKNLGVALNSFQLSAKESERIADVYVASTASTAAGVEDMGEAINYSAATAYNSGQTFEETAAAIGILADNGQYGSRAGTTLKNMLTRLANPSSKASDALEAMGVVAYDAAGNMKPLNEIIGQLEKAQKKLTSEEMTRYVSQAFGAQAAGGVLSLIGEGQKRLLEVTKEMENAGGVAQEKADTVSEGTAASLKELQNSLYTAQINMLKAIEPVLVPILKFLTLALNTFSGMDEGAQRVVAGLLLVVAGVGPVIGAFFGIWRIMSAINGLATFAGLAKGASGAAKIIGAVGTASSAVTTASSGAAMTGAVTGSGGIAGLLALIPVWGWIALAITAAAATFLYFYKNSEGFKGWVDGIWFNIKQGFTSGGEWLGTFFTNLIPNMLRGINTGKELLNTTMLGIWDLVTFKNSDVGTVGATFGSILTNIKEQYDGLKAHIQENKMTLFDSLGGLGTSVTELFDVVGQVSTIIIDDTLAKLNETLGPTMEVLNGYFGGLGESAKQYAGAAGASVKQFTGDTFGGIGAWFTTLGSNIEGVMIGMLNSAGMYIDDFLNLGTNIVKGLSNGITGGAVWAIDGITSLIDGIKNTLINKFDIHSPSRYMEDFIGTNLILGLVNGIKGQESLATDSMQNIANNLENVDFKSNLPKLPILDNELTGKYDAYVKSDVSANVNGRQPAYINLNLGGSEYKTFVDDITRTQDSQTNLQSAYY